MKKLMLAGLLAALLPVSASFAQDAAKPDRKAMAQQFNQRFTEADANGDGKLTREEAQAKMPKVAAHFDEIDVDKKGYVTKQEVMKAMRKMAAERKAAKSDS